MPRWQLKVKREAVARQDDMIRGKRLSQIRHTVRCHNSVELSPNPPLLAPIYNGDHRTLIPFRHRIPPLLHRRQIEPVHDLRHPRTADVLQAGQLRLIGHHGVIQPENGQGAINFVTRGKRRRIGVGSALGCKCFLLRQPHSKRTFELIVITRRFQVS